ncbi:hypothetical protein MMC18_003289 [Xylographa bjoerkii]|nr:hypothetical protein [Xylographa bjoerkii]
MPVITLSQRQNDPTIISGNPPLNYYPDAVVYSNSGTNAGTIVGVIVAFLLTILLGVAIWWLVRRAHRMRVGGVQNGGGNSQTAFQAMFKRKGNAPAEAGSSAESYDMTAV